MNETELNEILDAAWRRPLTEAEQAALADWARRHPAQRAEMEAVLAVSRGLEGLPAPTASSNFMSRVWREVEAGERIESRPGQASASGAGPRLWRLWLPRFATGLVAVAIAGGSWWRYEAGRRAVIVRGITAAANVDDSPDLAMLREFEAIKILGEAPASVDVELLAALQ
ncbi:MAG: hypothetical protein HYR88_18735 [Verrucomicrobia bacterium]|nr:hypothetical protein [Verrucomicrobiota bacterium]